MPLLPLPPSSLLVQPDRERLIVTPVGELDICTADPLRETLAGALDAGWSEVVLDLRRVTFLDSQGVHVLLDARAAFEASSAHLTLVDGLSGVMRILDLLDVRSAFASAREPVPR